MSQEVSSIRCLTGTEAELMEFNVKQDARITEAPLKEINFPKDAIVGGVIRGRSSFIARGNTEIRPNDKVVVFALPSAIQSIQKFFK